MSSEAVKQASRKWYIKHRAEHLERSKKRHIKKRTQILEAAKQRHLQNPALALEAQKRWRIMHYEHAMWRAAARRAAQKRLEFTITVQDIVVPSECPILGIPLKTCNGRGGAKDSSPSLDRINNTQGYTKDNIHVISNRANRLKSDMTFTEIQRLYAYMQKL